MPNRDSSLSGSSARAYFYLILVTSLWGSLYVVSRYALRSLPPLTILCFRYLVAAVALHLLLRGRSFPSIARGDRKYVFLVGFLGYFLAIGAQMLGTKLANASVAALVNATNPVFIILFAVPLLGERLTWPKATAVTASLLGVFVILHHGGAGGTASGIAMSLISVITWSLMTILVRRISGRYDPLLITARAISVALVFTVPAAFLEWTHVSHGPLVTPTNLVCLLYMGVFCTAIPHLLWNRSLSLIEAGRCSLFYPLQPLVAALLGALFLGEAIDGSFVLGAALVVGGILVGILGLRLEGRA